MWNIDAKREFKGIETSRLIIEYISKRYAQEIFDEKNNKAVNIYLASRSAPTLDALLSRIDSVSKDNKAQEIIQLQVSEKVDNTFIWLCGIKKPNSGYPEIGLWLKESSWWKWYGKELVGWLVDWIKQNLNHEYIIYETFEDNIWSIKIVESLWWVKHGVEPKENYFGEVLDHAQYRIYKGW